MNNANGGQSCSVKCWTAAGVIGAFVALMAIAVAGKGIFAGLVLGILAAVLLGWLFNWLFCADVPAIGASSLASEATDGVSGASASPATSAASTAPAAAANGAPVSTPKPADTADVVSTEASAKGDDTAQAEVHPEAEQNDAVKPTTALAGEADLAERKGEWRYDGTESDSASEAASDGAGSVAGDASSADADADRTENANASKETAPEPATSDETGDVAAAPVMKPSTALPGQEELAGRKGTWRYEGGDKAAADAQEPVVAATNKVAPEAEPVARAQDTSVTASAEKDLGPDFDGDGVKEGTDEGSKPSLLDAPQEGGPDNLKEIKGIGPKLEKVCHSLGIYHFSQIAAWSEDEVAWANANLVGFKGRVTRDNWVEQAKILAAGGETEFSKRVDKGGVY
ncbi:MAG: hypothetical protein ACRBB0_07460 [Pelagimonas sp.]|uniref:hypothetical protein n=1 Tax=Pelagimonas sp. TaxID=2073170 RepID=UPI003D6AEB2D